MITPPGQTAELRAQSVLVVAPHPDDETLGCGGLLARLTADGAVARVLYLSDGGGDLEGDQRKTHAGRRRQEAEAAGQVLGVAGADFLDLTDGRLVDHRGAIARGLHRALLSLRPDLLLVPSPVEASHDHRAAFAGVHHLLTTVRPGDELSPLADELRILTYEINHPQRPDLLIGVDAQIPRIEAAMACHSSQQAEHDYLAARLGLLRFRSLTLPPDVRHAEAYRQLTVNDFVTRSLAGLIAHLGGNAPTLEVKEGPRISVIVRTKDRPELLTEALASLAASTYRRLQVVVVNDGGAPPVIADDFPLDLKRVDLGTNQGRAAAANAGIEAAEGEAIAFLDDDDRVEPEHFELLAGAFSAPGVEVVYSDAAVGVYTLGAAGWTCHERRLPYSRDFDADLLLLDNYIPFNTLVIDRRLALEVGPLDPELTFFEDWDFLIRLAQRTAFNHLPRVTCEYRQFRGAGHHVLGDGPRQRSDFLAMKARVIERHLDQASPVLLARVVDGLRGETVVAQEASRHLRDELAEERERYHRLNGRLAAAETHAAVLEGSERRALDRGRELEERERELSAELRAAYGEIERLGELIRAMEGTRAWRTHQWIEGLKGGGRS